MCERNLNGLQQQLFIEYTRNGYLKSWTDESGDLATQRKFDIAEISLVMTEVSEAIELLRDGIYSSQDMAFECADILIRTLNFMSRIGFTDTETIIRLKNEKNLKRKTLHRRMV